MPKTHNPVKKKRFYDPLYFANVVLEVGTHAEVIDCWITREVKPDKTVWYTVRLNKKENFYGLMHECIHLVRHIFDDRQIPFDSKNDEAVAYYMMYWFKRLWRAANK
jgi:hypothetical protein